MRLTDDLKGRKAIFAKGWLFLILGIFASGLLLLLHPEVLTLGLLAVTVWAFCRWYYFAFYVIERYVDPSFRFAGLSSLLRYLWHSRHD